MELIKLELTKAQFSVVMNALARQQYFQVAETINALSVQAQGQIKPPADQKGKKP